MDYGFKYEEPKQEDYIFGDANLKATVLQQDGQWDAYLPQDEFQHPYNFETYACASFATLNAIEILLRRLYNFKDNFSDRYLAKVSGTEVTRGNSPHKVAETIRKQGIIDEYEWPFLREIDTFEKFYATPPSTFIVSAERFLYHYDFYHDYVPNDPMSMMEALRYSPLGMSVFGWNMGPDGLYQAGNGADNHFVCVYGYEEEKYWKVFDTYDSTHKMVEWKHKPLTVKRYHIDLAPATRTWLEKITKLLKD